MQQIVTCCIGDQRHEYLGNYCKIFDMGPAEHTVSSDWSALTPLAKRGKLKTREHKQHFRRVVSGILATDLF